MTTMLIIEDEKNKCKQIEEFVKVNWSCTSITVKKSFHSGMKEILNNKYDIILMDMTLPTYDITIHEAGGPMLANGGLNILSEMKRKKRNSKVIIVTQYESFDTGPIVMTLDQLKCELEIYKPNYVGTVYFNTATSKWKEDLYAMINTELTC